METLLNNSKIINKIYPFKYNLLYCTICYNFLCTMHFNDDYDPEKNEM